MKLIGYMFFILQGIILFYLVRLFIIDFEKIKSKFAAQRFIMRCALSISFLMILMAFVYSSYLIVDYYHTRIYKLSHVQNKGPFIPIAVIGGGPAGLSAGMYGARAGFHTVVFQGYEVGGQLMGTGIVENWPGMQAEKGAKIINSFEQQVEKYGAKLTAKKIKSIDCSRWPFVLETGQGEKIYALSVILATGGVPRNLGVSGEKEYWGSAHGVVGCTKCDAPFTKDKKVIVVGGGDMALEYALQLTPYAKEIKVFVRSNILRASMHMQKKLADFPQIKLVYNTQITAIKGDGSRITHVETLDPKTGKQGTESVDWLFLAIGYKPDSELAQGKLSISDDGFIKVGSHNQQTSVEGVFAGGNCADPLYRQAVTAAGDGSKAGMDAMNFLYTLEDEIMDHVKLNLYDPHK